MIQKKLVMSGLLTGLLVIALAVTGCPTGGGDGTGPSGDTEAKNMTITGDDGSGNSVVITIAKSEANAKAVTAYKPANGNYYTVTYDGKIVDQGTITITGNTWKFTSTVQTTVSFTLTNAGGNFTVTTGAITITQNGSGSINVSGTLKADYGDSGNITAEKFTDVTGAAVAKEDGTPYTENIDFVEYWDGIGDEKSTVKISNISNSFVKIENGNLTVKLGIPSSNLKSMSELDNGMTASPASAQFLQIVGFYTSGLKEFLCYAPSSDLNDFSVLIYSSVACTVSGTNNHGLKLSVNLSQGWNRVKMSSATHKWWIVNTNYTGGGKVPDTE